MCIVLFPHYQELLAKKCAYNLVYESWIFGTLDKINFLYGFS